MALMTKQKLPFVNRHVNRHGKVYWFFRSRHGKRIRLFGEYGSKEWMDCYKAALAGDTRPKVPPTRSSKGSLLWAVDMWKRSSDWLQRSPATRKQRDNILQHVLAKSGDRDLEDITAADIRKGRENRQATPAAANNFLKTMRAFFLWAKKEQLVELDPACDVEFLSVKTEGFKPWVMDDVVLYRKRWALGTTQRLALEIFLNTGLRRGDAAALGWQHISDGLIQMRAGKNRVELYIPILPALQEALDAMPKRRGLALLLTRHERPFAKESLGNLFREWCDEAGVRKSAHGIRKLVATTLADAGGSEQQLQALMGWTTNDMSLIYTRGRDRKKQALAAAFKLMGEMEQKEGKTALSLPTPMERGGQRPKKLQ